MKYFTGSLLLSLLSCFVYGQDLVVSQVGGAWSYDRHEEFRPDIYIRNQGIIDIDDGFYIESRVFLSTDNVLSDDDHYMGITSPYEAYVAGETKEATCYQCTANVPTGNYFMIVQLDQNELVTETDENNLYVYPGYVVTEPDVDWKFNTLSVSSPVTYRHDRVAINYIFINQGTTNTGGMLRATFYLSADQTWDNSDAQLDVMNHSVYGHENFSLMNWGAEFMIPGNTTPGQYYIIGKIDQMGAETHFDETDEANNTITSASVVTVNDADIDLEVTINGPPNYVVDQNNVFAILVVKNNGSTGVWGYDIRASISADSQVGEDLELSPEGIFTFHHDKYLAAGESQVVFFHQPVLNRNIPPGAYALVLEINPGHTVSESNTTNNFAVSEYNSIYFDIQFTPFITIDTANFSGVIDDADTELSLDITYTNTGTGTNYNTCSFDIIVKDAAGNTPYTTRQHITLFLFPGQSETRSWPVILDQPLPEGTYEVTIRCSNPTQCLTTDDYNFALNVVRPAVTLSGTIRGEDGTPIDKGKLFLYQKMDNGKVKFIQKTVPTTSTQFSYAVDNHPHTLYFIPDPVSFPAYAPTIYGKTVTLKPGSYITTTENREVLLEVLKLDPLATGKMTVTGNVNTGGTSRTATAREAGEALEDYPVILLSESGEAVALAMTDENGNYEFHNLPAAKYKVIVAFELDQAVMEEPLPVDVTTHDAKVDIAVTPEGTLNTISKSTERISLHVPSVKTFGDQPVNISATSTSGLPVTFASANPAVAEVINGKLLIRGAGTVTIMATTSGNDQFWPGTTWQSLTVNKRHQYITFGGIPAMTVHDKNYSLPATASSTLPLTVTSDNEQVATVDGMELIINGPGVANITIAQNGDGNFNAALPVTRQLVVNVVMGIEESAGNFCPYPNPTTGLVYLAFKEAVHHVEVVDALGKVHENILWTNEQIDLSSLNAGVYFIKVQHAPASTVFRIVKE